MVGIQQTEHVAATASENASDVPDSMRRVIRVRTEDTQYAIEPKDVECVSPLMELQSVSSGAYYLAGVK